MHATVRATEHSEIAEPTFLGARSGGVGVFVNRGQFKLIPRILLFGDKNETYIDTKENRKIDIKYCMPTVMTRSCENERMGDYNAGVTHLQHRI